MQKIASQEAIIFLWYSHHAARSLIYRYNQSNIVDNLYYSGISTRKVLILQQLQILQRYIKKACSVKQFATALEQFHIAEVVSLYTKATVQRKNTGYISQESLVDQFASIFFPDIIYNNRIKV